MLKEFTTMLVHGPSPRLQRLFAPILALVILATYLVQGAPPVHATASSSIVISQVYGGGGNSGAVFKHDFVELFNRGTTVVDLTGWSVQYTSATGTAWASTSLSGTIKPGQYFLVQQGAGTGGTAALPTPDTTGTINLNATAGKVALVTTALPLAGACPVGPSLPDFVGYGNATACFEGSGPTPSLSNTTAAKRTGNGCLDTDINAANFSADAPSPRNSGAPVNLCPTGDAAPHQDATANRNIVLGNPSGATADPVNANNYLIARDQYVLSYNRDGGIPNWVSWHLRAADMGNVERSEFQPDTTLPTGWYQVKPSDYTYSGYDRGHIAPSADRTATEQDNEALFLMSNIVPQAPDNNQGPWAQLEERARDLVRAGNEVYIISGVIGTREILAKGNVRVPEHLWKVIVVLPEGDNDLQRITAQTEVIAVAMPNRQGIRYDAWQTYRTSVDQIEAQTGYDLLSNVTADVQAQIEARVATP
jgi:endonuclease G